MPEKNRATSSDAGHSLLQDVLSELVIALLASGVTPKTFSELSRHAFVHAAAARSKLRNGKVNYSRVAAQTGYARADVRRILHSEVPSASSASALAPVSRVLDAWHSDRSFASGSRRPRSLSIANGSRSFMALARKHAGDVPYRAVLTELQDRGAVRVAGDRVYLQTARRSARERLARLASLALIAPALIDGLRMANSRQDDLGGKVYRLTLPVTTERDRAFLVERCHSSALAMLNALGGSLKLNRSGSAARGRKSPHAITVTILLNFGDP